MSQRQWVSHGVISPLEGSSLTSAVLSVLAAAITGIAYLVREVHNCCITLADTVSSPSTLSCPISYLSWKLPRCSPCPCCTRLSQAHPEPPSACSS